ncbi:hypothetical protein GCM10009646_86490 [Streptomyces aureus]
MTPLAALAADAAGEDRGGPGEPDVELPCAACSGWSPCVLGRRRSVMWRLRVPLQHDGRIVHICATFGMAGATHHRYRQVVADVRARYIGGWPGRRGAVGGRVQRPGRRWGSVVRSCRNGYTSSRSGGVTFSRRAAAIA